ncbi:/mediator of replication checkpoint protein (similar to) [Blumeria hordei DH14]|uniref:/mediator of replication checkpoint protein (Similar to) n=1 Tax=Blumeria graminis f. sp. hordei (strain DH14) TaxID=546991 RepID=N1JKS5_BLUG1|nr:/mediator of replication checkpoint protein (similar to) [Blumeria hordei DH14]
MTFTREVSPEECEAQLSPAVFLTPNSKVKALLAKLDDYENELNGASARDKLLAVMSQPKAKSSTTQYSSTVSEGRLFSDVDNLRPKGPLAAKILAKQQYSDLGSASKSRLPTSEESLQGSMVVGSKATHSGIIEKKECSIPQRTEQTIRPSTSSKTYSSSSPPSPSLFVSPLRLPKSVSHTASSETESLEDEDVDHKNSIISTMNTVDDELCTQKEITNKTCVKMPKRKQKLSFQVIEGQSDESETEENLILAQRSKSIRKASKKALEDINRETQRLSRQQQLAHKATTKKKITKESLFSKFNFRSNSEPQSNEPEAYQLNVPHIPKTEQKDATAYSPVSQENTMSKSTIAQVSLETRSTRQEIVVNDISTVIPITYQESIVQNDQIYPLANNSFKSNQKTAINLQHKLRKNLSKMNYGNHDSLLEESDSDLEIIGKRDVLKQRLNHVFNSAPKKKVERANGLHALKILAQLNSSSTNQKSRDRVLSTSKELHIELQQRARQQAAREKEERLAQLYAKGITIQTNEERERDQVDLDDLLSKARTEADNLGKQEKAEAKKSKRKENNADQVTSYNEDWSEAEQTSSDNFTFSDDESQNDDNSEEESNVSEEVKDGSIPNQNSHTTAQDILLTKQSEDEETCEDFDMSTELDVREFENEDDAYPKISVPRRRHVRILNIISDDEDDLYAIKPESVDSKANLAQNFPKSPSTTICCVTKPFIPGVQVSGPAGLGLTQIFQGTMDEIPSSNEVISMSEKTNEDLNNTQSIAFSPRPTFLANSLETGILHPTQVPQSSDFRCKISAVEGNQDSPTCREDEKFGKEFHETNFTQFAEPTQDVGFAPLSPFEDRFLDISSPKAENICAQQSEHKNIKRKRLHRRAPEITYLSDEENDEGIEGISTKDFKGDESDLEANVFDALQKTTRREKNYTKNFSKKTSEAKNLFHEQAEESEDEYAGLGGFSEDESGSDDENEIQEMIDDAEGKEFDEHQHAALYADYERKSDEKQVKKLYNDITKGTLRRKRRAEFDLSDSEDDGAARQRRKQREFARMRKALLADERIGEIAVNPKRQAFLRAIEDRCSEDEIDFLHIHEEQYEIKGSKSASDNAVENISLYQELPSCIDPKPSGEKSYKSTPRYSKGPPKPSTLSEVRASLLSLIEEVNVEAPLQPGPESDDDLEIVGDTVSSDTQGSNARETLDPFALRRHTGIVIDRFLAQQTASLTSASTSASRPAFAPSSVANASSLPPIMRRFTTDQSYTCGISNGVKGKGLVIPERSEIRPQGDGVKRGGTRGSGINYFARENERRAKVMVIEQRRQHKLLESAAHRRRMVGGLLGGGQFD